MDSLGNLFSNFTYIIRYILTGAVVSTVVVLSKSNWMRLLTWASVNQLASFAIIVSVGFLVFTLFRVLSWTILDSLTWHTGLSAPSIISPPRCIGYFCWIIPRCSYALPYAHFVTWRYSREFSKRLSGYLRMRWSVAHFVLLFGITLLLASQLAQHLSPVSSNAWLVLALGLVCFVLGIWQCLFRVLPR